MFDVLSTRWVDPYGVPDEAVMDDDTAFAGEIEVCITELGVFVFKVPPGGHEKLGKADRHNHLWRTMFHRVVDAHAIHTLAEARRAKTVTTNAKNPLLRRKGRAPVQAAFGRMPRVPGALLQDDK